MASLMQAFNTGFQAMQRTKKQVTPEIKAIRKEKTNKKMKKIHSSMANLEALTSKLKMSFGDSEPEPSNENNV